MELSGPVDGTGNPGFYASLGVEGEMVHIFRGDLSGTEAALVIDAKSKVVCPGFIDMPGCVSSLLM